MSSGSVTPISQARKKRQLRALIAQEDPTGLFSIPFKDVLQGVDSANISKSDPVTLGGTAETAVRRLMAEFGVVGSLPQTYGELMGLVMYCKQLHDAVKFQRNNPADDALWERCVAETLYERAPEMVESYEAYKAGNREALQRISRERLTLQVMSQHFDLQGGWRHDAR